MHWEIHETTAWPLMLLIALTLGLRHGLDLDHLATIDAITRTARDNRIVSKLTGFLFSLGHGIVVTSMSIIIGAGLLESRVPQWLEGFGAWVSIVFLSLFGVLNLWSVCQNSNSYMPAGMKSFIVKKVMGKKFNPAVVVGIGALFAFSFDTVSQIALFAISATFMSGWLFAGVLGLMFTLGMMITDGCNGLFVATLIQRADQKSRVLSRALGVLVAGFSLGIGGMGLFNLLRHTH